MTFRIIVAGAAALACSTALAAQTPSGAVLSASPSSQAAQAVVTKVGSTQMLGVYSYIPDKCEARGHTRVEIVRQPKLGALVVRDNVPFTITQSNYNQCIGVPSQGTGIFYRSSQPGQDTMRVRVTYPDNHQEAVEIATVAN